MKSTIVDISNRNKIIALKENLQKYVIGQEELVEKFNHRNFN